VESDNTFLIGNDNTLIVRCCNTLVVGSSNKESLIRNSLGVGRAFNSLGGKGR